MNKIFIFLTLLGTISGAEVLANGKFYTGARSGADCPSCSYVGNGFCKPNRKTDGREYFPSRGEGDFNCPPSSTYMGKGYCKTRTGGDKFFPAKGIWKDECPFFS